MHRLTLLLFAALSTAGCARSYTQRTEPPIDGRVPYPVYSDLRYWAAHPAKKDPSDSLPEPLRGEPRDTVADVFFIHPTTYVGMMTGWNAELADAALNRRTDETTILYQASVFNGHARVFAPRYRQGHLSAFFTRGAQSAPFDTAYADVKAAFNYYLEHEHRNRPLIIAGHSQGALMAERLLREYFDGKPLQRYLVAAYIIGWPVPQNYFAVLPPCRKPAETGCFCTWRTYRKNYVPEYIQKEDPPAWVTNPLSWTLDSAVAPRELNKGSVMRDFTKVFPATTDAVIGEGVLWVSKPKFPGGAFFWTKNYHIADINLFYLNIRANVAERVDAYLQGQNSKIKSQN